MTDSITIKIAGLEYTDFTHVSVTKSIETLAGSFTIKATSTPNVDFPIKVNSRCQIMIQGEQVLNGFVERLSINYEAEAGSGSHDIVVSGNDRTIDLYDSTVGGNESSEFSASKNGVTLKQIAEKVLDQFNMSVIEVIDDGSLRPFKQGTVSAEYGVSCFKFLEKYAQKRQVLITTNGDGNLVFMRAPSNIFKTHLILSKNAPSTILRGSIRYNNAKRFHEYIGSTQGNPSGISQFSTNPKAIASVSSGKKPIFDEDIRSSRVYHFEPSFSSSQESLTDRVKWEANFRRSQSQILIYTVQGHIAKEDSQIWRPGYRVVVNDEFANITNQTLLISSVKYEFNASGGSTTVLRLLPEDSFTLLVNKPQLEKSSSKKDSTEYISIPQEQALAGVKKVLGES